MLQQWLAWSVIVKILEKWVLYRIYRNTLPKQGQIKPRTILSYFLALKLYYINRYLSFEVFDISRIALIIKGKKKLFPKQKATCLPITKNILEKIIENESIDFNELNIDTVFKVA